MRHADKCVVEVTPEMLARGVELAEEMADNMGLTVLGGGAVSRLSWEWFVERLFRDALAGGRSE